jgi:hypothetical protein
MLYAPKFSTRSKRKQIKETSMRKTSTAAARRNKKLHGNLTIWFGPGRPIELVLRAGRSWRSHRGTQVDLQLLSPVKHRSAQADLTVIRAPPSLCEHGRDKAQGLSPELQAALGPLLQVREGDQRTHFFCALFRHLKIGADENVAILSGFPHALERCRSRHPHLQASQGGVRGAEVEVRVLCLVHR